MNNRESAPREGLELTSAVGTPATTGWGVPNAAGELVAWYPPSLWVRFRSNALAAATEATERAASEREALEREPFRVSEVVEVELSELEPSTKSENAR